MKISAIAALCKKRASLYIDPESEGEGVIQYIGCGAAAYAIDGMPRLTKDSAATLFDIPEDKKQKFSLTEHDIHKFILTGAEEFPITANWVRIVWMGEEYAVYHIDGHASSGVLCINTKYLKPLTTELFDEFYAREQGGHWGIIVKRGFEIRAVICITKEPLKEVCLDAIASINLGLQRAAELEGKVEQSEDDPMEGQHSMFDEPEPEFEEDENGEGGKEGEEKKEGDDDA